MVLSTLASALPIAWVTDFCLPCRIQKRLGYRSPCRVDEKHYADQTAVEPANLKPRHPALAFRSASPAQRGNLTGARRGR
ncbi:hypothetical protein ACIA6D_43525 [Streptomyces cacaoi]